MLDSLVSLIAPHHCYMCRVAGPALCVHCIYNIKNEASLGCFYCNVPSLTGVCPRCISRSPFSHFFVVGQRQDELKQLLDDYKFNRAYALHQALATLLDAILPFLPLNTVIIPLPTISRHQRIRGYDHTNLLARTVAQRRGLVKCTLLKRKTNSVQRGASAKQRHEQAQRAYYCDTLLNPATPYLLIDDIVTTGATMRAAAGCLKAAGAQTIMAAAIARQIL